MHRQLSKIEVIISRSPVAQLLKRHKRHADAQLYLVLSNCLEIAELYQKDPKERRVMDNLVANLPTIEGKNRSYVEHSSDVYQRVCRFMFHGEEHTANTNRYAHCLREAARQGVNSKSLVKELNLGGVNKFYIKRPSQLHGAVVSTKCLRLNRTISHPRHGAITLTLVHDFGSTYHVQEEFT